MHVKFAFILSFVGLLNCVSMMPKTKSDGKVSDVNAISMNVGKGIVGRRADSVREIRAAVLQNRQVAPVVLKRLKTINQSTAKDDPFGERCLK